MPTLTRKDVTVGHVRTQRTAAGDRERLALDVAVAPFESLSRDEWLRLFPEHPMAFEDMTLSSRVGMDGFTFRFIVVRRGGELLLALPTFECRFDVSAMVRGPARPVLRALSKVLGPFLRPRLLGIGLVEGEWGAVGRSPDAGPHLIAEACRRAFEELEALRGRTRAQMLVLLDMAPGEIAVLEPAFRGRFETVGTSPCAQLPLTFKTVEEYLAGLSRTTRQKIRRRAKSTAQHVRVERTTDVSSRLDDVYRLYRSTVEAAPVSLGVQRRDYFARICREVEGAQYVLYWLGDRLVAFNLLIAGAETLLDKYFCMDPVAGREHHLYFFSWLENIGWATSHGLSLYHAGAGAEETKQHLGCRMVSTQTMFRHARPLVHRCLALVSRRLVGSGRLPAGSTE
jgi:hypothetical protein